MNPIRWVRDELDPFILGFLLVTVLLLVVDLALRRGRARAERRGRRTGERGGDGYHPADLRGPDRPQPRSVDPQEAWLLGLPAPLVESAGLAHDRWDLRPTADEAAWRRHLARLLVEYDLASRARWESRLADLEARGGSDAIRPDTAAVPDPWKAAHHAMAIRLGVAAGHLTADEARRRVERFSAELRSRYTDWFAFAEALTAAARAAEPSRLPGLKATMRVLYAPGGPWAQPSWPRRSGRDARRDRLDPA